jgi:hypothetical protein
MKMYPYANLKFKTSLSKEEILGRLHVIVEPVKKVRMPLSASKKPYEGEVNEDDFSMMLLAKYARKNMAPVKGKIEQDVGGYVVNAKVRLSIFAYLIILFFIALFLIILYTTVLYPLLTGTPTADELSFAFSIVSYFAFFAVLFYVLEMIPFLRMYNRIKKDFCMLLKTEEVEDLGIRGERRKEYE